MTPTPQQSALPPTSNQAYQPTQFQTHPIAPTQQPVFNQTAPVAQLPQQPPTPEPPKQKPPLPEEYVYWQTVFTELRVQCINQANNPVSYSRSMHLCWM